MKYVYPDIDSVFDTDGEKVNSLVIENSALLISLLNDISSQIDGDDGRSVLSDNNKELAFSKSAELITQFVPFELSRKNLITKIYSTLEKMAMDDENLPKTMELLCSIEKYLNELSFGLNCDLNFDKITAASLIKSSKLYVNEEYSSLPEKIIDYFELVTEFDRKKLFITLNLRGFMSFSEAEKFIDTVLDHQFNLLMIETSEHEHLKNEKRYIVDADLCEIS